MSRCGYIVNRQQLNEVGATKQSKGPWRQRKREREHERSEGPKREKVSEWHTLGINWPEKGKAREERSCGDRGHFEKREEDKKD